MPGTGEAVRAPLGTCDGTGILQAEVCWSSQLDVDTTDMQNLHLHGRRKIQKTGTGHM